MSCWGQEKLSPFNVTQIFVHCQMFNFLPTPACIFLMLPCRTMLLSSKGVDKQYKEKSNASTLSKRRAQIMFLGSFTCSWLVCQTYSSCSVQTKIPSMKTTEFQDLWNFESSESFTVVFTVDWLQITYWKIVYWSYLFYGVLKGIDVSGILHMICPHHLFVGWTSILPQWLELSNHDGNWRNRQIADSHAMAPMFRMPIPMEFPYPCSRGLEISSSSSQLFPQLTSQTIKEWKGFPSCLIFNYQLTGHFWWYWLIQYL